MLGPEANHYVTVSHPQNFPGARASFGDLIPLLGDGLLTIDGAYHDRARRIMMPAFHREQIEAAVAAMVVGDRDRARGAGAGRDRRRLRLGPQPGDADRDAGARSASTPTTAASGAAAAQHFERALAFYGIDFHLRLLRGPRSPWRRLVASRAVLDEIVYTEIARAPAAARPRAPRHPQPAHRGPRRGRRRPSPTTQIRDQLMTLMFAGHDTSTSTISFLFYELARHPRALARLQAEQDEVLGGRPPTADQLFGELPYLDMVLDETLRLYPPAWIGPRRAVREFEFAGHRVPAGAYVNYCSWASHRLPEVFPDPEAFVPERFSASARPRSRAAPTSRSAAARGSASASASGRPR